ncbi:MAG: hypothetical protein JWP25_6071 [Bradyrhizobium sp.]|nr:hypothetical protein [Bradyrhizobium sp.]
MKRILLGAALCAVAGLSTPASAADMQIEICNSRWRPPCRDYPPVTTAVPPSVSVAPGESYSLNLKNLSREQVEFILHAMNADTSKVDLSPH